MRGMRGMRWGVLAMLLSACAAGSISEGDPEEQEEGGGGFGGTPAPPSAALDCNGPPTETAAGRCEGNIFQYCNGNELTNIPCDNLGGQCGFKPGTGQFGCIPADAPLPDPSPSPDPLPPPMEPDPGPGGGQPEPPVEPEPPPDMPCVNTPEGSVCVGDTVIICRGGEPGGRTDCAMNGLSCGPVPSGGMGCVAGGDPPPEGGGEPEPEDPMPPGPGGDGVCAGRQGGARCDGNIVVRCLNGAEDSRFDCSSNGQTCANFDNEWAGCEGENMNPDVPEPDPPGEACTPENFFGRCVGNVLEGCNLIEMEVFRLDCGVFGATCRIQDGIIGCY